MKCVIDAANGKWKRAAAMGKCDTQCRKSLEHAAKNHRTDPETRFRRHRNQPWQPVFRHTLAAQHVPRVNKDRGIEFFSSAPDRLKRRIIEVQSIYASEIRIRINVRSDLSAAKPKFPD